MITELIIKAVRTSLPYCGHIMSQEEHILIIFMSVTASHGRGFCLRNFSNVSSCPYQLYLYIKIIMNASHDNIWKRN